MQKTLKIENLPVQNLQDITNAVDRGKKVYWRQENYIVTKDHAGQYLIKCLNNDNCIGLTWKDGVTLNGNIEDFFIINDEVVKIKKHCLYEDLSENLKKAMILALDWDTEAEEGTRIDCCDPDGDLMFSMVEQKHVENYLQDHEEPHVKQLLDFMRQHEIEFIKY